MKPDWLCAEKVTAVSVGIAGLIMGDAGLITGGAIAGAGLVDGWLRDRRADGLQSKKLLSEVRAALLTDYAAWEEGRDLAEVDLIAADRALDRHLIDCMPTVAELAGMTFTDEKFPANVARLVVDKLAKQNPIFSEFHSESSPTAREFALLVMNVALIKAKEQPAFLQRLTQEVVLLLPQQQASIASALKAADEGSQARDAQYSAKIDQLIDIHKQNAAPDGVSAARLLMLAQRVVPEVVDEDEAARALSAMVDEFIQLRAKTERGSNFGEEFDDANRRIFARVVANDLDGAKLQGVEESRRLAEMRQRIQAAEASVAETNLSVARLAFDAHAMAHWAVERRKLAEGLSALSPEQLCSEQRSWHWSAMRRGLRLEMDVAIHLGNRAVAEAKTPWERATCENELGITLAAQGERSSGAEGLKFLASAVDAYNNALKVYTLEQSPVSWAEIQCNLGNVFRLQGQRSGGESGLNRLASAVNAFESGLEVFRVYGMSFDWASAQSDRGSALTLLGQRGNGAAALYLLERAVEAFEAAKEIQVHLGRPDILALTHNNLGNALSLLAQKGDGPAALKLLDRAETAFNDALEVRSCADMPADWAQTQNNRGLTLLAKGQRTGGSEGLALLVRAEEALYLALKVRTRAQMPAEWAQTQLNLGMTKEQMGNLEIGAARLAHWRSAEAEMLLALEVFDQNGMGHFYGSTIEVLARVRAKIAGVV